MLQKFTYEVRLEDLQRRVLHVRAVWDYDIGSTNDYIGK